MNPTPPTIIGRAELAVEEWAARVSVYRSELAQAEQALGVAVDRAHRARKAFGKAEAQFENAQALLRKAKELS